jgi:cell division protein FtsA
MRRGGTFAAIDVGTTKVCTAVGDVLQDGELRILGVGVAPSAGLTKGMVENIHKATEAIRSSVDKAERASGTKILSAYVGIAGAHVNSMNNRGVIAIPNRARPISDDDVARAIDAARTIAIPTNRHLLHVVPRYYIVDGQDNVSDPIGMFGQRLDVETHIITGSLAPMQNLEKCIERAGVQVDELVVQPLASAEAVLEPEERSQGVILADIGGGTTDIAIFLDGTVLHTAVLPLGGYHLTHDLVAGLRVPNTAAEEAKTRHGHALPSAVDADETVDLEAFGSERRRSVYRRHICEILQARCEEIIEMVGMEAKRAGQAEMLAAGLVLTGGTANLPGLDLLAEKVLNIPARIGVPKASQGLIDSIGDPAYATAVGLLHWAVRENAPFLKPAGSHSNGFGVGDVFRKVGDWVRVLLPQ